MRRLWIILICLLLSGCQSVTFSVDGLLSAPNIADEQSAIYQALIESAGRNITLEYPRSGEYRSAFVAYDIDGDKEEETLAFYSVSSVADSNVKISVLDRDGDGAWHSTFELAGAGNSVETVEFLGCDAIVGYAAQEYEENALGIYRFENGTLQPIYEDSYSFMETVDLDGCGTEEIATVGRSGLGMEITVLKPGESGVYTKYDYNLESGEAAVYGCKIGELGGAKALYIDLAADAGRLYTELFLLKEGGIFAPINSAGTEALTLRPSGYPSSDYDGDGQIEIPTVSPFYGYESSDRAPTEYMTSFWDYNEETMSLEFESNAYCNISDGYAFTIPNRWLNVVTVLKDGSTGEVTFYRYDPAAERISDMSPIITFASAESSGGRAYETAGYTLLKETDSRSYYFIVRASGDEPLVLTFDEIRDNFRVFE